MLDYECENVFAQYANDGSNAQIIFAFLYAGTVFCSFYRAGIALRKINSMF